MDRFDRGILFATIIAVVCLSMTVLNQDKKIQHLKACIDIEDGVLRVNEVRTHAVNILHNDDDAPAISLQTDDNGVPSISLVDRSQQYPDDVVDMLILRVDGKKREHLIQGLHHNFRGDTADEYFWPNMRSLTREDIQ